jgi:hypothetical protein
MGDERCRDHRAGAGPIFDDDRLPKPLADALGRKSGDQVIRTARPEPDDPADWMVRPFRTRRRRSEPTDKEANGKNYGPIYHYFFLPSEQSSGIASNKYKGCLAESIAVASRQFVARFA